MRISDWSSDVCSSDLAALSPRRQHQALSVALSDGRIYARGTAGARAGAAAAARWRAGRPHPRRGADRDAVLSDLARATPRPGADGRGCGIGDRKSVVEGKGVSGRLDIGGRRIIKKK